MSLMMTKEETLLELVWVLDPDDEGMTPKSLACVSILDYIINRSVYRSIDGLSEQEFKEYLKAQQTILDKLCSLALGDVAPDKENEQTSKKGKEKTGKTSGKSSQHYGQEQKKKICLQKFF